MDKKDEKEKERWYPGKYLAKAAVRRSSQRQTKEEGVAPTHSTNDFHSEIHSDVEEVSEIIGSLKISISEVKYLRAHSPQVLIQCGKSSSSYNNADPSKNKLERTFDICELVNDIRICVKGKSEKGESVCGLVVVPIISLLSATGRPIAPKEQWMQLYQINYSRISNGNFKFISGYSDLPGYAMTRPRDPLGYVCFTAELTLDKPGLHAYLSKSKFSWMDLKLQTNFLQSIDQDFSDGNSDKQTSSQHTIANSNAELCAMINRDLIRILALLKVPFILSSFFSVPDVLVINSLIFFLGLSLAAWQIPFALFGLIVLNGIVTMNQRNYGNVIMWNDPLPLSLEQQMQHAEQTSSNSAATTTGSTATAVAAASNHNASFSSNDSNTSTGSNAAVPALTVTSGSSADQIALATIIGVSPPAPHQYYPSSLCLAASGGVTAVGAVSHHHHHGSAAAAVEPILSDDHLEKPFIVRLLLQQNISLYRISKTLSLVAHWMEVVSNALSFADMRVSLIAFAGLAITAVIHSLLLHMFSVRIYVMMMAITVITLSSTCGAILLEVIEVQAAGGLQLQLAARVMNFLDCFAGYLSRIPDELELTHRYIAAAAVVNPKGSEMQDAAAAYEKFPVNFMTANQNEFALNKIQNILNEFYPQPPVPLDHVNDFTFLVAVVLSAQTTDGKVNDATKVLFQHAKTPLEMSKLDPDFVLDIIRPVGLAPKKSKYIVELSKMLVDKFGEKIPSNFEDLESLPGVGHKTASVIMSQLFGVPSFAVDTHVHRLALRWGISKDLKNVNTVQRDLCKAFPINTWNKLHLQMIYFGREYCTAKDHINSECPICSWINDKSSKIVNTNQFSPKKPPKGVITYNERLAALATNPSLAYCSNHYATNTTATNNIKDNNTLAAASLETSSSSSVVVKVDSDGSDASAVFIESNNQKQHSNRKRLHKIDDMPTAVGRKIKAKKML